MKKTQKGLEAMLNGLQAVLKELPKEIKGRKDQYSPEEYEKIQNALKQLDPQGKLKELTQARQDLHEAIKKKL